MNPDSTGYCHTQRGPWGIFLFALSALFFTVGWWLFGDVPFALFLLPMVGLLTLALCVHHLTVADEGVRLKIRFGPIPLFQKRIPYENVLQIEIGRTTILDGWGIHMSLRGGWVWNVWGRDCVVVHHRGITRIGTDDAQHLAAFLTTKIPAHAKSKQREVPPMMLPTFSGRE